MNDEKLTVDNRKNYDMIDIFKLVSAVLVVFILFSLHIEYSFMLFGVFTNI